MEVAKKKAGGERPDRLTPAQDKALIDSYMAFVAKEKAGRKQQKSAKKGS